MSDRTRLTSLDTNCKTIHRDIGIPHNAVAVFLHVYLCSFAKFGVTRILILCIGYSA